jgi:AhpC/TSA antioxidant enzyme
MLDQLVQLKPEMERSGLRLAAVTQGNPQETLAFCRQRAPGVVCLSDPGRVAYHAYGLGKANIYQAFLSPQVWSGNAKAKEHGYKPELPPEGQDALQMSGTFIIGTDGHIRLPYYYHNIADHPPASLLLKGVLSTDWAKPLNAPLG